MTGESHRGDRGANSSLVHRGVERLYHRRGPRVLLSAVAVCCLIVALAGMVVTVMLAGYLEISSGEQARAFGVASLFVFAGIGIGLWRVRDTTRTILSWQARRTDPARAIAVWSAAVTASWTIVIRTAAWGALGLGLSIPLLLPIYDVPAHAVPALIVGAASAVVSSAVLGAAVTDLLLRPLVTDVARHLPPDFEPGVPMWRLRTKALAPLPFITFFAAVLVGAYADASNDGATRLTIAVAAALGVVSIAGAVLFVLTRSSLDPLDDLVDATQRVRRGNLTTQIPIVTADDLGTLTASFNAMVHDLRRHTEELRESRARIVATADAERRRMERDLHDGAQQHLVLLQMKLSGLVRDARGDPDLVARLEDLGADVNRAAEELRDLAHGIYPPTLQNDGLAAALGDAAQRAAIPTTIDCNGRRRYPPDVEAAVYFCCLEALQNVTKHAGEGATASVRLSEDDGALRFEVTDTGRGFNVRPWGHGLQNMADRIGAVGGELRIDSGPGGGTIVRARVPVG